LAERAAVARSPASGGEATTVGVRVELEYLAPASRGTGPQRAGFRRGVDAVRTAPDRQDEPIGQEPDLVAMTGSVMKVTGAEPAIWEPETTPTASALVRRLILLEARPSSPS
jgi:hypothetical protein